MTQKIFRRQPHYVCPQYFYECAFKVELRVTALDYIAFIPSSSSFIIMVYIKRSCCSNSVEALGVLKVLSLISGYEVATFEKNDTNSSVELSVVTQNPFAPSSSEVADVATAAVVVSKGLLNCIKKVCAPDELGLLGKDDDEVKAIQDWIERCSNSSTDREMFARHVENELSRTATSYLIGNAVTVADVAVSIHLYCYNNNNNNDVIMTASSHPNTQQFMDLILLRNQQLKDVLLQLIQEHTITVSTTTSTTNTNLTLVLDDYPQLSEDVCSSNPILSALTKASIPYYAYAHTLSKTADELITNVPLPHMDHVHTKNLLFKDKKHGLFYVVTAASSSKPITGADITKSLSTLVQGKANFRLATPDVLKDTLGVDPGCLGPLALLNNINNNNKITLVLDEHLIQNYSYIHSHPLINTISCMLRPKDLLFFLKEITNHEPILVSIASSVSASSSNEPNSNTNENTTTNTKQQPKMQQQQQQQHAQAKATTKKGETLLALQWKKSENFPNWYSDVITLSEMISYYNISGCYILRPWSYKIWELIQNWFNEQIQEFGVENAYFPMFVSKDRLEKEKDHVEGFAPEVAWVTKSGDTDLAVPIAIRPTSETIMYPAFSDWIKSHRDLPLKINQWSNVVRWEFKYPTPFLRTREFLWQEGHTAHSTHDEAGEMVMKALDWYRAVYEELLAIPVIKGFKTEKEKFAGGHRTTTVEAYVPGSGRSIQGATSHDLGQNFGKMFDISFQNEKGTSETAWQTSWGLTTRTIGVMVMLHGDDQGLVLPPHVAPLQCVIVPIVSKSCPMECISPYCQDVLMKLKNAGIRIKYDDRTIYNPGWKYNHWEQKGVPIRIEIGPRDMEGSQVRIVVRRNGEKQDIKVDVDSFAPFIVEKLATIQKEMYDSAKEVRDAHLVQVTEWKDFVPNLEKNNMVLTPWIGGEHQDWEEWVKEKSRQESLAISGDDAEDDRCATSVAAKTLCIPFDQPVLPPGTKCIASNEEATCWILWGRSY